MSGLDLSFYSPGEIDNFTGAYVKDMRYDDVQDVLTIVRHDDSQTEIGGLVPPTPRDISDISYDGNGQLIVTFSNAETIDVGYGGNQFIATGLEFTGEGIYSVQSSAFKPLRVDPSILTFTAGTDSATLDSTRLTELVDVAWTARAHEESLFAFEYDTDSGSIASVAGDNIVQWNAEVKSTNNVTLAGNNFNVQPGTYKLDLRASVCNSGESFMELRRVADDAVVATSNTVVANQDIINCTLRINDIIHFSSSEELYLAIYCENANAFGLAFIEPTEHIVEPVRINTASFTKVEDVDLTYVNAVDLPLPSPWAEFKTYTDGNAAVVPEIKPLREGIFDDAIGQVLYTATQIIFLPDLGNIAFIYDKSRTLQASVKVPIEGPFNFGKIIGDNVYLPKTDLTSVVKMSLTDYSVTQLDYANTSGNVRDVYQVSDVVHYVCATDVIALNTADDSFSVATAAVPIADIDSLTDYVTHEDTDNVIFATKSTALVYSKVDFTKTTLDLSVEPGATLPVYDTVNDKLKQLELVGGAVSETYSLGLTSHENSEIIVSATSEYSGSYAAWKAFISNQPSASNVAWISKDNPSVSSPQAMQVQYKSGPKRVTGYWFNCRPSYPNAPADWTFEGSNDGTTWDVLDSVSGNTLNVGGFDSGPDGPYYYKYSIDPSKVAPYEYYRLNVTKAMGAQSYTTLASFMLINEGAPAQNLVEVDLGNVQTTTALTGDLLLGKTGELIYYDGALRYFNQDAASVLATIDESTDEITLNTVKLSNAKIKDMAIDGTTVYSTHDSAAVGLGFVYDGTDYFDFNLKGNVLITKGVSIDYFRNAKAYNGYGIVMPHRASWYYAWNVSEELIVANELAYGYDDTNASFLAAISKNNGDFTAYPYLGDSALHIEGVGQPRQLELAQKPLELITPQLTSNLTSKAEGDYVITGSSELAPTYGLWEAFDQMTESGSYPGWVSESRAFSEADPHFIQIELPVAKSIDQFQYQTTYNYYPTTGALLGSNNGTDWTELARISNAPTEAHTDSELFPIADDTAYKFYRFELYSGVSTYVALGELRLFKELPAANLYKAFPALDYREKLNYKVRASSTYTANTLYIESNVLNPHEPESNTDTWLSATIAGDQWIELELPESVNAAVIEVWSGHSNYYANRLNVLTSEDGSIWEEAGELIYTGPFEKRELYFSPLKTLKYVKVEVIETTGASYTSIGKVQVLIDSPVANTQIYGTPRLEKFRPKVSGALRWNEGITFNVAQGINRDDYNIDGIINEVAADVNNDSALLQKDGPTFQIDYTLDQPQTMERLIVINGHSTSYSFSNVKLLASDDGETYDVTLLDADPLNTTAYLRSIDKPVTATQAYKYYRLEFTPNHGTYLGLDKTYLIHDGNANKAALSNDFTPLELPTSDFKFENVIETGTESFIIGSEQSAIWHVPADGKEGWLAKLGNYTGFDFGFHDPVSNLTYVKAVGSNDIVCIQDPSLIYSASVTNGHLHVAYAPNGKVVIVPQTNSQKFHELDFILGTQFSGQYGTELLNSGDKFADVFTGPNGKLYAIPFDHPSVIEIDPVSRTWSEIMTLDTDYSTGNYGAACREPNGKILMIPLDSDDTRQPFLVVDFDGANEAPQILKDGPFLK